MIPSLSFFFFHFFFHFFLLLHLFIYSFQHINKIIKYITCQNNHIRIVEATPVSEDPHNHSINY